MSWDQTDRLLWRTFLGTPTGQKILIHLMENRPPAIPKEFRDPKALGNVENLQLLGAYGFKASGWDECTEYLSEMGDEKLPESVTAFNYTNPAYDREHEPENENEL